MPNQQVTDDQIRALRDESTRAGDHAQALICELALGEVKLDADTTLESLRIAAFLSPSEKCRISAMDADDCRDECVRVIDDAAARA